MSCLPFYSFSMIKKILVWKSNLILIESSPIFFTTSGREHELLGISRSKQKKKVFCKPQKFQEIQSISKKRNKTNKWTVLVARRTNKNPSMKVSAVLEIQQIANISGLETLKLRNPQHIKNPHSFKMKISRIFLTLLDLLIVILVYRRLLRWSRWHRKSNKRSYETILCSF